MHIAWLIHFLFQLFDDINSYALKGVFCIRETMLKSNRGNSRPFQGLKKKVKEIFKKYI